MSQPTTNEAAARHGWFYVGKLAVSTFGILFCLVTLKFFTEHKLAPSNFGLGGVLYQPRLDLLLIGSSHTRKSYDMRLLEKATGVTSSYQISYDGTDLSVISQMLDYLVANPDHCPRYLVIEAYSTMLARPPDLRDPRYFSDAPPVLKLAIIQSYLSDHRERLAILDIIDLVVNRGNEEIVTYPFYSRILKRGSYKGGRADVFFPGLSAEQFRQLKIDLDTDVPNPAQLGALYRVIDITRSHNIAVIFIDPPMPQPVTSNPNIQSLKRKFSELLRDRSIPYIDGDQGFPTGDPAMFSDNNHLSTKGRQEFTLKVGVELKSWIASEPGAK